MEIPDLIRTKINLLPPEITRIRIVEIVGVDLQADGGTHVHSTREVGGIKVLQDREQGQAEQAHGNRAGGWRYGMTGPSKQTYPARAQAQPTPRRRRGARAAKTAKASEDDQGQPTRRSRATTQRRGATAPDGQLFEPVPAPTRVDYPLLEREVQQWWDEHDILQQVSDTQRRQSEKRWSFIDGPITANNPMGVHHAWGRTYKDLYQRYNTMLGHKQRYQNGFDCQGLWVEVEVEKELGFTNKRDIEAVRHRRVRRAAARSACCRFAARQTEQSIRLGYWMDWDDSYFTMSDENNYTIWRLPQDLPRARLALRGPRRDALVPALRHRPLRHGDQTEGYTEVTHTSVYVRFPLLDRPNEYLLVWTTTPWTLTANVAAAVNRS